MGLAAIFTIKLHETSQKLGLLFFSNLLTLPTQLKIPVISLTSSDSCAPQRRVLTCDLRHLQALLTPPGTSIHPWDFQVLLLPLQYWQQNERWKGSLKRDNNKCRAFILCHSLYIVTRIPGCGYQQGWEGPGRRQTWGIGAGPSSQSYIPALQLLK